MKVTFISSTQPSPELIAQGIKSAEDMIIYCARVSSPQNQLATDTAPRLMRHLIKHRHWSPFEMADMTVEIETSRAIAAQLLRHWSLSFQEFSQRYAKASMGFEKHEARGKAGANNRQGSTDNLPREVKDWWRQAEDNAQAFLEELYDEAIAKGVAPEQARMLLPLSTTTRIYAKGTVRDWVHYLALRTDSHAQQEHREMALAIKAIFDQHFPSVAQALADQEAKVKALQDAQAELLHVTKAARDALKGGIDNISDTEFEVVVEDLDEAIEAAETANKTA